MSLRDDIDVLQEKQQQLLDNFAAHALTGILASHAMEGERLPTPDKAAADAYEYAKVMMRERKDRDEVGERRGCKQMRWRSI